MELIITSIICILIGTFVSIKIVKAGGDEDDKI